MAVYFLDANGVERIKRTCGKVLDDPVRIQPDQQLPYFPHEQVHHAVYITGGIGTNGRYPAKLQYRVENATTEGGDPKPSWVDFDPSILCWAIGFEGESLKVDSRYHGFLVDEYTDVENDAAPIYACVTSLSVRPVMVYDGPYDGRYLGWIEYRDETLPAFLPFDPLQYVWIIGYNGEALEAGKRYKGLFVSTDPVNGLPVYAAQPLGGGGGITARVTEYDCIDARASVALIKPAAAADGTWEDVDSSTFTNYAYHFQKGAGPFASGGPLVAVDTRVRLFAAGVREDGTATYYFDCPAGFTGLETVMTDWQCVDGVGTKTIMYRESWNGQQTRAMTLNPPTGSACG